MDFDFLGRGYILFSQFRKILDRATGFDFFLNLKTLKCDLLHRVDLPNNIGKTNGRRDCAKVRQENGCEKFLYN